jgi:cell division protein FtsN
MTQGRTLSRDYKRLEGQRGQPFSGWVGLILGLAIGLSVALGVLLHDRDRAPTEPHGAAAKAPTSAQATEDYTFPDILRKGEQVQTQAENAGGKGSAVATELIILQAGWFQQPADAEKLQAKLSQHGIDSTIQRFTRGDETWYRVRIGPIETGQDIRTLRGRLADAEVEMTPMTRGAWEPLP